MYVCGTVVTPAPVVCIGDPSAQSQSMLRMSLDCIKVPFIVADTTQTPDGDVVLLHDSVIVGMKVGGGVGTVTDTVVDALPNVVVAPEPPVTITFAVALPAAV